MPFKVSNEFRNFLLMEDFKQQHPKHEPFITVALSKTFKSYNEEIKGNLKEIIYIKAFLVPKHQKSKAMGKYNFGNSPSGEDYFSEDGSYHTGEISADEETGIRTEIVVNDRLFDGIDNLHYFEPTDRMVRYLKLHRVGRNWTNPYTGDTIIETEGENDKEEELGIRYLKIRKSELIDYLAARQCGLLIVRYSRRMVMTSTKLSGLPESSNDKKTTHGKMNWFAGRNEASPENYLYFSRLWDSFWIDPAKKPRRWDAESHDDRKGTVSFQQEDGEHDTYDDEDEDFLKVISFNPSLVKSFLSSPNNKIIFYSISTLGLKYSDGSLLKGCINKEGQFQVFFGDIDRSLEEKKQRELAGYSEPLKAKINKEFYQTMIEAKFPETKPFIWTLFKSLEKINTAWANKVGKSLLLSPEDSGIKDHLLIGPISKDFDELVDLMLEYRKLIIPEYKIDEIKTNLDYSKLAADKASYKNMRSIAFTKLFFRANRNDGQEGESYILALLNDLRNCKGHPSDTEKTLSKYGIKEKNPRWLFLFIMAELCGFLLAFKNLTEICFSQKIDISECNDLWAQLEMAKKYFKNPS